MMSLINATNPSLCLCAYCQLNGKHFSCGATSKIIHEIDAMMWPDSTFMKWKAHFEHTPLLKWNRKFNDPSKLAASRTEMSTLSLASGGTSISGPT